MPEVKHVFIDMDGVLVNFQEAALRVFGWSIIEEADDGMLLQEEGTGNETIYPWGERSIPKVIGVSSSRFWKEIAAHDGFWEKLQPYEWMKELLKLCRPHGFTVASTPADDPACPGGKIAWLKKHIRSDFEDFLLGKDKFHMAKEGTILIDDHDDNIKAFQDAGGTGILVPQYWNTGHKDRDDPLAPVRDFFSS